MLQRGVANMVPYFLDDLQGTSFSKQGRLTHAGSLMQTLARHPRSKAKVATPAANGLTMVEKAPPDPEFESLLRYIQESRGIDFAVTSGPA